MTTEARTEVLLRLVFTGDEDAADRAMALRDHLLDTFNDDDSLIEVARVTPGAIEAGLVEPPIWNPRAFADDGDEGVDLSPEQGAWMCSACGSTELEDEEYHPIERRIDLDKSTPELLHFDGMGECAYESAERACVYCRDCSARMEYPEGIERDYA